MRRSNRRQPDGPARASICTGKKFNSCFDHFRHCPSNGRLAGAESRTTCSFDAGRGFSTALVSTCMLCVIKGAGRHETISPSFGRASHPMA
jgi:hypothetical protein